MQTLPLLLAYELQGMHHDSRRVYQLAQRLDADKDYTRESAAVPGPTIRVLCGSQVTQ